MSGMAIGGGAVAESEKSKKRAKKLHITRLQKESSSGAPPADADCYTCRRRRVRCDRTLPTCRKCARAEYECAGYTKGFRWVGGIASRGRMMGRSTYDEEGGGDDGLGGRVVREIPSLNPETAVARCASIPTAMPGPVMYPSDPAENGSEPLLDTDLEALTEGEALAAAHETDGLETIYSTDATATQWSYYFATSPNYGCIRAKSGLYYHIVPTGKQYTLSLSAETSDSSAPISQTSIASLIDFYVSTPAAAPSMIGSLDATARYYLSFFDQMCGIFLLFDRHPLNPYRELLLSTLHFPQPALLSTILAVSARYHENVTGHHYTTTTTTTARGRPRPDLAYYNQALVYLNRDLQDEDRMLEDATLASVLFFLFYETLDSGLDTWRWHLGGARKLVELKTRRMGGGGAGVLKLTHMQAFILHSIALFDIIGSTLVTDRQPSVLALPSLSLSLSAPSTQPLPPPPSTTTTTALTTLDTTIFPLLVQGELFSFLACPPEILQIILKITLLSSHPYLSQFQHAHSPHSASAPPLPAESVRDFTSTRASLLHAITTFDPTPWITKHTHHHQQPPGRRSTATISATPRDLWHHVSAYKSAVVIYLLRVLYPHPLDPWGGGGGGGVNGIEPTISIPTLTTSLFTHLTLLPRTSPLFKGTVWPSFIAGTEARDEAEKGCVRGWFEGLWGVLRCCNVRNGIGVLEELWRERERGGGGGGGAGAGGTGGNGQGGWWVGGRIVGEVGEGRGEGDGDGETGEEGDRGGKSQSHSHSQPQPQDSWQRYMQRKGVEWLFI